MTIGVVESTPQFRNSWPKAIGSRSAPGCSLKVVSWSTSTDTAPPRSWSGPDSALDSAAKTITRRDRIKRAASSAEMTAALEVGGGVDVAPPTLVSSKDEPQLDRIDKAGARRMA